jgi:hypothetical protein
MKLAFSFVFTFIIWNKSFSQNVDNLKILDSEIPIGYKKDAQLKYISIEASTFFQNPEIYSALVGDVSEKTFQSFSNKGEHGSILYFRFSQEIKNEDFFKALLWGVKGKPSMEHPEEYFIHHNFLIIWCLKEESVIKQLSKSKIFKILSASDAKKDTTGSIDH